MVKSTLADFTDADLLVRPAPAANHTAWQLGHLIVAEVSLFNAVGFGAVTLPADFAAKFTKETSKSDDPAAFPKKDELLSQFEAVRTAVGTWVKGLTSEDLDRPTPEKLRGWVKTVGHLIAVTPVHVAMHIGQFQVIRRKLGKPVLM